MAILRGLALGLALGVALLIGGCVQALNFNECNTDPDCARFAVDGGVAYCTSDRWCVNQLPEERLCAEMMGIPGPGSLPLASLVNRSTALSQAVEKAIRLAVDEINQRQAGANQPPLVLYLCDGASDPAQALRALSYASTKYKIAGVIGPATSGELVAMNQDLVNRGVLAISPAATAVDISLLQDNSLVWRTVPSDRFQAVVLAEQVRKELPAPTKVEILYLDAVYGKGLSDAFASAYSGMPQVANRIRYTSPSDLAAALAMLAADAPSHAVLIPSSRDAPSLVAMLGAQKGLANTRFFMTDTARSPAIFGPAEMPVDKTVLDRIRGTAPATPVGNRSPFVNFSAAFKASYGTDPTAFTANAYDAVYLVAIAAAATAKPGFVPGGAELAAGLARVRCANGEARLDVGTNGYLTALTKLSAGSVCLDGASGPLDFDGNGDLITGAIDLWGVDTTKMPFSIKTLPQ